MPPCRGLLDPGCASPCLAASDWRLPTMEELAFLAEETCFNPAINTTAFPATPSDWFWSGSPHANGSYDAWYVDFLYGNEDDNFRGNDDVHVRLVRDGQSFNPLPSFSVSTKVSGNGTVSGSGNFTAGKTVNLTATPATGYTFSGWSPAPCANSFTMPSHDLTCTATFIQEACTYSISPNSRSHTAEVVADSLIITASRNDCAWTASSNMSWARLGNASGTGSGSINYSLQANGDTEARSALLQIAGQSFTLHQAAPAQAACTYTLSPSSASHPAEGGTGSLSINTVAYCDWTVSEADSWLSITSPLSGTGSGIVQYRLDANAQQTTRNGALKHRGLQFSPSASRGD